jgi:hypothetical protein
MARLIAANSPGGGCGCPCGPGTHLVAQLAGRDDLVHQSPLQCLLGAEPAQHEPDLAGPLLSDHPGHIAGAQAGVERAHAWAVLAELGGVRGDGEVAQKV